MADLSVIIPFCNEYPQVMFTIRNIAEELRDRVDFEIVVVDNSKSKESISQVLDPVLKTYWGKDSEAVKACERGHSWLKVVEYSDHLSHWQCKNYGVKKSTGSTLWFVDSHVIVGRNSLYDMYKWYTDNDIQGTGHLPLTYKILEWHRLIYKLVTTPEEGVYGYSFTPYRGNDRPFEVPVMSCCGVMLSRKLYNEFGGWPSTLGIYGGGEQFLNFTLATMGYKKYIAPGWLCHHGEKRGYHYNYDNFVRNKILAAYMYGGKAIATLFVNHLIGINKGRPSVLNAMLQDVQNTQKDQRELIKSKQTIDIRDWAEGWMR